MAASRKPVVSKKRKVSSEDLTLHHAHAQPEPGMKKKSPLFNQPQNYYAPPSISSMSKEELSAWRKEQRRKRNRESAAASRNKTRVRIEELEGEVTKWKSMYHDMEMKMRCMERHIQFLIAANNNKAPTPPPSSQQHLPEAASVVSHPSPPRSPEPYGSHNIMPAVVPSVVTSFAPPPPAYHSSHANSATNPFPPLLSELKDCTAVETREATLSSPSAANVVVMSEGESKKHINQISRQAVKITGANFDSSSKDIDLKQQQKEEEKQLPALPKCDPLVTTKEVDGMASGGSVVSDGGASEVVPTEATKGAMTQGTMNQAPKTTEDVAALSVDPSPPTCSPESSDDDGDFLDLLVDTLDGEFDPELLI